MSVRDGWTRAPIRSSCWRVHTIAGVERTLFWWMVLPTILASGLTWFAGAWYVTPVLLAVVFSVLELCRRATLEDPRAPRVWLRWVFEPNNVRAVGRFDARLNGTRKRR